MNRMLSAINNLQKSDSSMDEMGSDDLMSNSCILKNMETASVLPVTAYSSNVFGTLIDNQQLINWSLVSGNSESSHSDYCQTIETADHFHSRQSSYLDLSIGKVVNIQTVFENANMKSQQQKKQSNISAHAKSSSDGIITEVNRTSHGTISQFGMPSEALLVMNIADRAIGHASETTACSTTNLLSKNMDFAQTTHSSEDATNFQDQPTLDERASEETYDQDENNLRQEGQAQEFEIGEIFIQYEDDLSDIAVPYELTDELAAIFDSFVENPENPEEQYLFIDSKSLHNTLMSENTQLDYMQVSPTQDKNIQPKTYITRPSLSISVDCKKGSCDNSKMFVATSGQGVKKLCCPYCLKPFSKLATHMTIKHKDEPDVQKIRSLDKGTKERRSYLDALRKLGTLKWNTNADLNKGQLIPSRRPNAKLNKKGSDYTTCPYCNGPYTKTNLRHHVAKCELNPVKGERILMTLGRAAEGRLDENASDYLAEVISPMRDDEIVRLIKFDWILIVYGNKLCCKYTPHYQQNMIRARLRLSGRLLNEIKRINPTVTDFASIYNTDNYRAMVSAIKIIGRFDPKTNEFGAPAMASNSVTIIKAIGKYLAAEYIFKHDRENKMVTEEFLIYMDSDIGISILKLVAETQSRLRREKKQNMPIMEDVKKLLMYINTERNACYSQLVNGYSLEKFKRLSELTAAWIIVFNRRRTGEVQNILVSEFIGRQSIDEDSNKDVLSKLSDESQQVARKFKRMKIRGKLGRTVPVLLKPVIDKEIELLLTHREDAGISPNNKYLFALPSADTRIRVVNACKALVDFSEKCGASNPSSLRGTNLRKHMATMCISMELSDAVVSEIADFMGHAVKIHNEYYRQNPIEREIVTVSKILEAAVGKCDDIGNNDESDEEENIDYDYCTIEDMEVGVSTGSADLEGGGQPQTSAANKRKGSNYKDDNISSHSSEIDLEDSMVGDQPQISAAKKMKRSNSKDGDTTANSSKIKYTKKRWSQDEIHAVYAAFPQHFIRKSLPTPQEITEQKGKYSALRGRTWQQIKTWINNQYKLKK